MQKAGSSATGQRWIGLFPDLELRIQQGYHFLAIAGTGQEDGESKRG